VVHEPSRQLFASDDRASFEPVTQRFRVSARKKLHQEPMPARVSAHRHYRRAPVVTMRVGADNWRTNSARTGAATMPVGAVAGLASVALFVGIHCFLDQ